MVSVSPMCIAECSALTWQRGEDQGERFAPGNSAPMKRDFSAEPLHCAKRMRLSITACRRETATAYCWSFHDPVLCLTGACALPPDGERRRRSANLQATNSSSARRAHLLSKGKITFQSFFMLMTVQPFFFASS